MTWTITATDTRVRKAASTTTTDNEKVKDMAVAAYRLAGYRVRVEKAEPAPDPQITLEDVEPS